MEIIPIHLEKESSRFDIFEKIIKNKQNIAIEDFDVLVISSKYLSIGEGRIRKLSDVKPSQEAILMAKNYHINSKMMELIIRESDEIFGGLYGFVLTSVHNILAPNAGIDKSNVPKDHVVLYPKHPYESLETLRNKFLISYGKKIGIVLSDSRILPMRKGTTGVALACSGFEPVIDLKGTKDLFGNVLKYTSQNIADCLASIGTMVMGESDASTPVIILRGLKMKFTNRPISSESLGIESKFDLYIRGLSGKPS
ncbi:coenzyme F420-0:L-glutamate ligase [Candidatus Nitrosocosmicus hydrocola]|uniref:coenzyme F420-0:L-glutamate ligase n=1 Tax=Candidatus Nitrosocosmicus hydrocola TaxID=1826872 RepID=UPI001372B06D|nr:coenzyme F420-0:L-glutamate ligase [Candidatus Nitrosocosmicus hydrocola]